MKPIIIFCLIATAQIQAADIGIKQALSTWAKANSVSFTIEYLAGKEEPQGAWARIQVPASSMPVEGEQGEQAQRRLEQGIAPLLVIPAQDRRTWHLIDRRVVGRSPCDMQVAVGAFESYACDLVQQLATGGKIPGVSLPIAFAVGDIGTGPMINRQRFDGRLREALTVTYAGVGAPDLSIQWVAECRSSPEGALTATMLFTGGKPKKKQDQRPTP